MNAPGKSFRTFDAHRFKQQADPIGDTSPGVTAIFETVSGITGISLEDIKSKSRKEKIIYARLCIVAAITELYPYGNHSHIAKLFNRDRTAIGYYNDVYKAESKTNPILKKIIEAFQPELLKIKAQVLLKK